MLLVNGLEPKKKDLVALFESRDLLMGKTPFTTALIVDGKVPFWDKHLLRLRNSFEFLFSEHSFEDLEKKIELCFSKIKELKGRYSLRLTMIEGKSEVLLITQIKELDDKKLTSLKLKTTRHPSRVSTLPKTLKYGNYLESMEKVKTAKEEGFDDCLFVEEDGKAAEASTSNIFFRRGNRFFTPPLKGPVLDGVTRKIILEILEENKFSVEELAPIRSEWESMEEVFITNSLKGIVPVEKIDAREFEVVSELMSKVKNSYEKKLSM